MACNIYKTESGKIIVLDDLNEIIISFNNSGDSKRTELEKKVQNVKNALKCFTRSVN